VRVLTSSPATPPRRPTTHPIRAAPLSQPRTYLRKTYSFMLWVQPYVRVFMSTYNISANKCAAKKSNRPMYRRDIVYRILCIPQGI
jgi:hypothetical protein